MAGVVEHLMGAGFKALYGYTQSDEISLLFDPAERAFGGKVRKYLSILAGEASGHLSLALGRVAAFDARLSLLPSDDLVVDYFRWRQEDSRRNALSAYGYWEQRKRGISVTEATRVAWMGWRSPTSSPSWPDSESTSRRAGLAEARDRHSLGDIQ